MASENSFDATTEFVDPVVARARHRLGETLRHKWHLDVLLGVGGMAAVYAATHRNGSRAAVKVLHPELLLNEEARRRFVREGYAANKLAHEGAVKVLDDDVAEDGSLFLVTELLDGETLEDRRLRLGGTLDTDEVLAAMDQVLDALDAAHAKGVVHRDLKPENLFLTRTGVVKVLDFGIARLRELSTASTATRSGATMGTPAFMPPEQARGLWDEVDGRSDLWAVGATMATLVTGRLVHEGRTANEMLLSAMTSPAPKLATLVPGVKDGFARVVDRALAFDRKDRWPDARTMQDAVRAAYHEAHGAPISTAPRLTVPPVVPNRTLPCAEVSPVVAARLPTTGQPVAAQSVPTAPSGSRSSLGRTAMLAGVAVALTLVGVGVSAGVWLASARGVPSVGATAPTQATAPPPASATTMETPAASTTTQSGARTPPEVPVLSVEELPTAATGATSKPAPASPAAVRPDAGIAAEVRPRTAPTQPPAATATPNCNPAFVIDPKSGKKTWKAECL